jgi:hypothetical protein
MPSHLIRLNRIGLKVEDLSETARQEAIHLPFHPVPEKGGKGYLWAGHMEGNSGALYAGP